jgi:hypothetical protein
MDPELRTLLLSIRQMLLGMVDAVERYLQMPRTADLRHKTAHKSDELDSKAING